MDKNSDSKSKSKVSNDKLRKIKTGTNNTIRELNNEDDSLTMEQENQYKEQITQLQKELEIEKEKSQSKQIDPSLISSLKNEIANKNKEIKKYANINTKQRDQLEQLSQEIDNKLNKMNYKAVTRNFQSENKKINYLSSAGVYNHFKHNSVNNSNTEQKTIDNSISAKEKQLKNIMSLIEILKKENENLKIKIENAKNTEQKFKLIDDKKDQEKQLINLNFDIKKKKMELKEHLRCPTIKAELLKKISMLKEEIVLAHEKLVEVQKKYDELKNKNKLEQQGLFNSKGEKLNKFGNKTKTKFQKYVVPKQKPAKVIQEESIIDVPPKIGEIFTDKELNAMFNALDKNRTKYDALLKRFNVQNIYVDSLEARHKLDIKQKLDKINELDEQIEFMSIKKGEYNANIQIYKKQILAAQEEKKNYKTKIDAVLEEISKKNKINSRKDNEIKQLQAQLAKFKKYLKNGEFDKIHNEPEIEIKGDEDDTENEGSNEAPVESTAKTGFYDNKENNLNNIKVKNNNETNEEQEENDDNNPKDDDTDNNKEVIVGDAGTNTDALV